MPKINPSELVAQLAVFRKEAKQKNENESPGIAWLRKMLASETDSENRYLLYEILITELSIQNNLHDAVNVAAQRLNEFTDIVSRTVLASVLFDLKRNEDAFNEYSIAFNEAVQTGKMRNYVFGEFMRAALKASRPELIDRICKEMLIASPALSGDDCGLETDWMGAAEVLGADPELIRKLRLYVPTAE